MKAICLFCGALWRDGEWIEEHDTLCFGQRYNFTDKREVASVWRRHIDPLPPVIETDKVEPKIIITVGD